MMSGTANSGLSKAENSNGKTLEIMAELCGSWGFNSVKNQVVSQLIKNLNQKGYDVQYTIDPLKGGNGEYFVYLIKEGQKQIIFSNDEDTHGDHGAVIGNSISSKNVEAIIGKIIS